MTADFGPNVRLGGLISPTQSRLQAEAGGPKSSSRALAFKLRLFTVRVGYTIPCDVAVILRGRRAFGRIPRRNVISDRGDFTTWAARW